MDPKLITTMQNQIETDVQVIRKFYPTADELCKVTTVLYCPEESCDAVFTSESNLNLHILKKHKKEDLQKNIFDREYYCPDQECVYYREKCFKSLKLLKQHFLKVHSEKQYLCDLCQKGFSTISAKKAHFDYCGVEFTCCNCDSTYASYESLMTHARRKKHAFLEKSAYKTSSTLEKIKTANICQLKSVEAFTPKPSSNYSLLKCVVINVTSEKSSQTDHCIETPQLHSKDTQVNEFSFDKANSIYSQCNSIETQTNEIELANMSSIETQTVGDYVVRKVKRSNPFTFEEEKKHNTTQTKHISSDTKSCNTYFKEDELENMGIERNSLGTQTFESERNEIISSISTATHDSIHTDTSDLNFEFMDSSSQTNLADELNLFVTSPFFNCNIETQTDFMLNEDLLNYPDSDSTISSQTQTNISNVFLNMNPYSDSSKECDVLFSNIHTQTVFDDMSRSVESQTMLFPIKTPFMNCRDYANMETQTDIDFRNMLEQINA
ncbi:transcription factor E4F1-like [Agrilus planipennis]|uniref:Transcription factor E4F1-like n=1 Tax=Agrilus planipennis TaxID=224129 RepID=A0A1W4XTJ6_AGRPL|nr:transcription factor E4F1-like [Agrilus planipennis]